MSRHGGLQHLLSSILVVALSTLAALLTLSTQAVAQSISLSPRQITFPTPTATHFNQGWIESDPIRVIVTFNIFWPIGSLATSLEADAPDMGGYGKPVSTLLYRVSGSSDWIPVSTQPQQISGRGFLAASTKVYFRILLDWQLDEPGTYSVPLQIKVLR